MGTYTPSSKQRVPALCIATKIRTICILYKLFHFIAIPNTFSTIGAMSCFSFYIFPFHKKLAQIVIDLETAHETKSMKPKPIEIIPYTASYYLRTCSPISRDDYRAVLFKAKLLLSEHLSFNTSSKVFYNQGYLISHFPTSWTRRQNWRFTN